MRFRPVLTAILLLAAAGAATAQPAGRLFDEESGRVEMQMSMMGMKVPMTISFDDWGRRTVTDIEMKMRGQTMRQRSVTLGDTTVQWDMQTLEGTRTRKGSGDVTSLSSYTTMSRARKKELHYRDLKGKTVLGRKAKGFSIDTAGTTMKIWLWKNIPVYLELRTNGMTIVMEATSIDLHTRVNPALFVVPDNVIIRDGSEAAEPESLDGTGRSEIPMEEAPVMIEEDPSAPRGQ